MLTVKRLEAYSNLNTPANDMSYEVERFLSFNDVNMLLTASQLCNNGFYYNPPIKKITCFCCKIEHKTDICNITHETFCKYKEYNIPFYVDRSAEQNESSFQNTVDSVVQHGLSPLAAATTTSKEFDMNNEEDRLKTFTKWNENVPIQPADLAHNGFYFKGFADVVVCAYCRLELRNWEEGDNVYTEHQRHSPNCSFLATVLELPKPLLTLNMKYEQNRLKTFEQVSDVFAICTKTLAQNGFYFVGPQDKVCCSSCKCELSNWKKEDNIRERHQAQSPNCRFAQSNDDLTNLTYYRSNIIFDRPKHPQFALLNDRLKTFIAWPTDKKQTPQLLAEAGFYHTGETDTVICYCCDGGLCNWDEQDDPWVEHARWYPRCTYIRQRKGDQFVASVKTQEFPYSPESYDGSFSDQFEEFAKFAADPGGAQGPPLNSELPAEQKVATPKLSMAPSLLKSPTVLAVLGLGYDEKIVEHVIQKKIKETGSPFGKASLLLEAVLKYIEEVGPDVPKKQPEESEEVHDAMGSHPENKNELSHAKKLKEENRLLKEQKTCKICLDNDLSIVFLPCGHFVSCETCAPSLKACPVCRSQILGIVRAYLS